MAARLVAVAWLIDRVLRSCRLVEQAVVVLVLVRGKEDGGVGMLASECEGKGFVRECTLGMHFWGGAGGSDGGDGGGDGGDGGAAAVRAAISSMEGGASQPVCVVLLSQTCHVPPHVVW